MIERHPFCSFIPPNTRYLILGSLTGREAVKGTQFTDDSYDWFYGTARNQFWLILEAVYQRELKDKRSKRSLFTERGIAIADIIAQCERRDGNNLDGNLVNIVYATEEITQILVGNPIRKIYYTSRFVEKKFRRVFRELIQQHPDVELITLPSPSPRYARMTKEQKINRYKELLP